MYSRAKYKENADTPWHSIPDPVASPKYDGAHFFVTVGSKGVLSYISKRQSVKGHYPDRTNQLPQLADVKLPQYEGNVYSVELIHTGHSKNNKENNVSTSGILNSLPERSIQTQKDTGPIRAVMLDVINPALPTYKAKLEHMNEFAKAFGKPNILFPLPTATTKEDIVKMISKTREEGREGVIVTSLTTPEISNKRIKIKHFYTFNLRIVGIEQEYDIKGNPKPSMGALRCVDSTGREVAMVGTGFSQELRREIWNNQREWIGKLITVKTMGLAAPGGKLRAPVYNGLADGDIDKV